MALQGICTRANSGPRKMTRYVWLSLSSVHTVWAVKWRAVVYVQTCSTFPLPTSWGPIMRQSLLATLSHKTSQDMLKHIAHCIYEQQCFWPTVPSDAENASSSSLVESCESDSVAKSNCLRILTPISTKTHTCTVIECDAIILVYSGTVCTRCTTHTK